MLHLPVLTSLHLLLLFSLGLVGAAFLKIVLLDGKGPSVEVVDFGGVSFGWRQLLKVLFSYQILHSLVNNLTSAAAHLRLLLLFVLMHGRHDRSCVFGLLVPDSTAVGAAHLGVGRGVGEDIFPPGVAQVVCLGLVHLVSLLFLAHY